MGDCRWQNSSYQFRETTWFGSLNLMRIFSSPCFIGYGFSLGGSMFIKEIDKNGMVARQGELKSGDVILKVCILLTSFL